MMHPFSREAFAHWCSFQSGEYTYLDESRCAVATYLHQLGLYEDNWAKHHALWELDRIASCEPNTYEALTLRLRQGLSAG